MTEFLCTWLPVFCLQAAADHLPREAAIAVVRDGPLEIVAAANAAAIDAGIHKNMSAAQALGRCPQARRWPVDRDKEHALTQRLIESMDRISPRVQIVGSDLAILDFAGLHALHGSAEMATQRMENEFAAAGLVLRTGIGAQPATALIAAKSGQGRLPAGREATCLAPLPISLLTELQELTKPLADATEVAETLMLLERWGVRTLGVLAALPSAALSARLGKAGVHLQALARGEVASILDAPPRLAASMTGEMQFDPPVCDLETIKAAVAHEVSILMPALDRQDRVVEKARLQLKLERGAADAVYLRAFALPTRDARTLTAQLHLELERTPPAAAVHDFTLTLQLARPRRIQAQLFSAATPDREKLPKLLALLEEMFNGSTGDRVGSPRLLDSHRPQGFTMEKFAPLEDVELKAPVALEACRCLALRVYRPPQPITLDGAEILNRAGPWRSLGGWWRDAGDAAQWACDEWDAEVRMRGEASPGLYRLLHDTVSRRWYILGRYD